MWVMTIDGQRPRCRVCREVLPDELYRLQEHARCERPQAPPSSVASVGDEDPGGTCR
jgi:hypothetical protein